MLTGTEDHERDDHDVDDHDSGEDALVAALAEIERHVGRAGWNQPARLFALVRTDELIRQEPSLAAHLAVGAPDGLSSVEQEDFHAGDDLAATLARIQWPPTVAGCAVAVERYALPPHLEAELPDDPSEADDFVAAHPDRLEVRMVAGALRSGPEHGLVRVASHPDDLFGGRDIVAGLTRACAETLR